MSNKTFLDKLFSYRDRRYRPRFNENRKLIKEARFYSKRVHLYEDFYVMQPYRSKRFGVRENFIYKELFLKKQIGKKYSDVEDKLNKSNNKITLQLKQINRFKKYHWAFADLFGHEDTIKAPIYSKTFKKYTIDENDIIRYEEYFFV